MELETHYAIQERRANGYEDHYRSGNRAEVFRLFAQLLKSGEVGIRVVRVDTRVFREQPEPVVTGDHLEISAFLRRGNK